MTPSWSTAHDAIRRHTVARALAPCKAVSSVAVLDEVWELTPQITQALPLFTSCAADIVRDAK